MGLRMRAVGNELAARLAETVHRLDLDNRALSMDRAHDEEENLARMLLAGAWYQVMARNPYGFTYTPLYLTAGRRAAETALARGWRCRHQRHGKAKAPAEPGPAR
ncbi:hypothetical protein [Streptomyces sp. NRRL S-448]|uniref:hypothetical protein n=1 Tax=Streptomyces sp. NRRL S-448 TaxID=1463907 RepID=UPI003568116C